MTRHSAAHNGPFFWVSNYGADTTRSGGFHTSTTRFLGAVFRAETLAELHYIRVQSRGDTVRNCNFALL